MLEEIGLKRLNTKHLVYVLLERKGKKLQGIYIRLNLVIAVYVDDIIIISRIRAVIKDFKDQLSSKFNIKNLGKASNYLGIEIVRNRAAGTLRIY